jgi:hypothetical protein
MADAQSRVTRLQRWTWTWWVVLAAGCLVGIAIPAGLGWDFANFYDAGRRVAAGEVTNLYDTPALIAGRPPQGTTGFFGTPLSALLYVPFGLFPAEVALVLFKISNVAALAVVFALLYRFYAPFAGGSGERRSTFAAWFACCCLCYQPFWTIFRVGGQTTPFVLLSLTIALLSHVRGAFWLSATGMAAAALIKPSLAPAVAFLMLVSGPRFLWRSIVVFSVAGVVSVAGLGWPVHASFLALMRASSQRTYAWYFNSSLFVLIDNLRAGLGDRADSGALRTLLAAMPFVLRFAMVGLVGLLTLQSRSAGWVPAARRHFDVQMAVVLFLLTSLTIWEHYLALLFPLLICLLATRLSTDRAMTRLIVAIVAVSFAQNLVLVDLVRQRVAVDSLARLMMVALVKTGPLLLLVVLLTRYRRQLFDSHAAPGWQASRLSEGAPGA